MFIPKKAKLLMGSPALDVSQVFSTDLYTGNGSTQTITTGLDMAGEGGLVWVKDRNGYSGQQGHYLMDTLRGAGVYLSTHNTSAELSTGRGSFLSTGYADGINWASDVNVVGWSFRRAPKFFDIVTWTGNGVAGRQIPHNLGTTPGMIVVKRRDSTGGWVVQHRSLGANDYLILSATSSKQTNSTVWPSSATSSYFTVGTDGSLNASGATYVAYVFAQNDDLIDCGSYVGNGSTSGPVVTCGSGWTPQWLLVKRTVNSGSWVMLDAQRGMDGSSDPYLFANLSNAEGAAATVNVLRNASGFQVAGTDSNINYSGDTYIYCAVRTPT